MDAQAIVRLVRDASRQWHLDVQVEDLPGGCRPYEITPIIVETKVDTRNGEVTRRQRYRAVGFLDETETYAYAVYKFFTREIDDEAVAEDQVIVLLVGPDMTP